MALGGSDGSRSPHCSGCMGPPCEKGRRAWGAVQGRAKSALSSSSLRGNHSCSHCRLAAHYCLQPPGSRQAERESAHVHSTAWRGHGTALGQRAHHRHQQRAAQQQPKGGHPPQAVGIPALQPASQVHAKDAWIPRSVDGVGGAKCGVALHETWGSTPRNVGWEERGAIREKSAQAAAMLSATICASPQCLAAGS